jgi:UDPglucose 6-dehydrogenase
MNICIIGTGYVGLVTGTCFAEMGNNVWCVDIDKNKIDNLQKGIVPIFEPGLEDLVKRNQKLGLLKFTTNLEEALANSLFAFIAVGTPPGEDGSADLSHVLNVARQIALKMTTYKIIVNKSTVPVGTALKVRSQVKQTLADRKKTIEFDVVSNPEFLKEGAAIDDFMKPDRIIIGTDNVRTEELVKELYSSFTRNGHPLITMDIASAELSKYAANAMLATRISFMNELSHLCEKTGADIENIRKGIGSDKRIGMSFLYAGIGYGGSCFPKDVKALIQTSKSMGMASLILESVERVNEEQKLRLFDKLKEFFKEQNESLQGKIFAVWGLAFKPNTDDMREAPALEIISALIQEGAAIQCFDPVAEENAKKILGEENIKYCPDHYQALEGADALLLLTEWHIFRKPDLDKVKSLLKRPLIFDGRNQYLPEKMQERGFTYFAIGRSAKSH